MASGYTDYLSLERFAQGQTDWHTGQQDNCDKIDAAIGKIKLTDGSEGALSAGDIVSCTGDWTIAEACAASGDNRPAIGICRSTTGSIATCQWNGIARNVNTVGSGDIVAGDVVFLSAVRGKATRTPPSLGSQIVQVIGRAMTAESGDSVNILLGLDLNPVQL
jgi:hypothetical protein